MFIMKLAISSLNCGLDSKIDPRFGRTKFLIIYDVDTQEIECIDNSKNYNAAQGAGIKTAELVVQKDCGVVISGHLGPKAFNALNNANIKCYQKASGTIGEAISEYQTGTLPETTQANVQGHW